MIHASLKSVEDVVWEETCDRHPYNPINRTGIEINTCSDIANGILVSGDQADVKYHFYLAQSDLESSMRFNLWQWRDSRHPDSLCRRCDRGVEHGF